MLYAIENGEFFNVVRAYVGHMFFHISLAHYFMNLLAIVFAGTYVFREMQAHARPDRSDASAAFIAFFLISGLAAGFCYAAWNLNAYMPMIGASGAAAGLFGAGVWILVMRGDGARRSIRYRAAALVLATLNIAMASYLLDTSFLSKFVLNGPSAWQAHLGGYLFGALFYPLFERMAASSKQID